MAKVKMVTRTVKVTEANVMCLDIERGEPFNERVTVSGVFDNTEKLLKACKDVIDTEAKKAVAVVEKNVIERLYGMTEQEFISLAEILPPRQAKDNEANEDNENKEV